MRDAVNKAARLVLTHCLENQIGVIVFGWNEENKKEINIGRVNNQHFVSIPTARLKNRIISIKINILTKVTEDPRSWRF